MEQIVKIDRIKLAADMAKHKTLLHHYETIRDEKDMLDRTKTATTKYKKQYQCTFDFYLREALDTIEKFTIK
jgi:hypothetical protein